MSLFPISNAIIYCKFIAWFSSSLKSFFTLLVIIIWSVCLLNMYANNGICSSSTDATYQIWERLDSYSFSCLQRMMNGKRCKKINSGDLGKVFVFFFKKILDWISSNCYLHFNRVTMSDPAPSGQEEWPWYIASYTL